MLWAIFEGDVLIAQVEATSAATSGVVMDGRSAVAIARKIDGRFESIDPVTGTITVDEDAYNPIGEALIDKAYELKVVVPAPAKAAEYTRKLAAATAYMDSEGAVTNELLTAEATLSGITVEELATSIIAASAAQDAILNEAALVRREAIQALRNAETLNDKYIVVNTYLGG